MTSQDYIGWIGVNSDLIWKRGKADPKICDPEDLDSDLLIKFYIYVFQNLRLRSGSIWCQNSGSFGGWIRCRLPNSLNFTSPRIYPRCSLHLNSKVNVPSKCESVLVLTEPHNWRNQLVRTKNLERTWSNNAAEIKRGPSPLVWIFKILGFQIVKFACDQLWKVSCIVSVQSPYKVFGRDLGHYWKWLQPRTKQNLFIPLTTKTHLAQGPSW